MTSTTRALRPGLMALALLAFAAPAAAQPVQDKKDPTVLDAAGNVVKKPLKDFNIIKPKVPPKLESIMAKPYDLTGLRNCAQYSREVKTLTGLIGDDVDSPQAVARGSSATEFAMTGAGDIIGSFIPGGGLIRKISGAEKAQKHAAAAVFAGAVRRSYIKGTARAKGCKI